MVNLVDGKVKVGRRMPPQEMRAHLNDSELIQFTGKGDADMVTKLYASFMDRIAGFSLLDPAC